jgi:hypothetical protein
MEFSRLKPEQNVLHPLVWRKQRRRKCYWGKRGAEAFNWKVKSWLANLFGAGAIEKM